MNKHPIETAAAIVGSYRALAEILGVTKGAVHQWMIPGRRVPIEHCAAIESATNGQVTRQMLRPDDWKQIWPELVELNPPDASDDVQPPVGGVKRDTKMSRIRMHEAS
ncbi:transcriptional regulator [Paraburkholderia bannensis]|uniref:transcriptional regulator n=1 Tax=Paraburkholderia bannensis TaxID=765414 RepID=UPI002ABD8B8A|nr:Cro/CI family transcriptional regulator [Paraburkholderia bannensis]